MQKLYRLAVFLGLILFLSFFYFSYSSKISLLDKNFFAKYVNMLFDNSIIKDNFAQLKKTIYFVQLGIFAKQSEVDKIRARMLLLGFDLNLKKIFFQGNIATKITLGPYDENILKDIEKILKKNNIKYLVINE
jgi:hypothetical protein|tara:strand:+ start:3569 stop:3967 length:399 start_codon:yes stop_codon:yes gene_type:complete